MIEKRHSSAFHNTDFHARLTEAGIGALVVVGIQTSRASTPLVVPPWPWAIR